MSANTVTGMVCGAAIVVILLATMLVPAIDEAQLTAGDEVTYTNAQDDTNIYMRSIEDGDTLLITADGVNNTTYELNGTEITNIAGGETINYHSLIFSDVYNLWTTSATGKPSSAGAGDTSITYGVIGTMEITYNSGTYTVDYTPTSGTASTLTYSDGTWGFIVCNEDEAEYYESIRTGNNPFYAKTTNDVVCSGIYTTGDFDTFYYYYNGTSGCNSGYTASTDVELTLADGTTDIYTGTVTVSISDGTDTEEFTPYRIMIPLEVTGHSASGAMYSIYGLIPIILVVALVMGAIGMIATGRRD